MKGYSDCILIILLPLYNTNPISIVPITLAIAIAIAAPFIPKEDMFKKFIPYINMYPNIIFITFINIVMYIGVFVSPQPRKIPLAICSIAMNGYVIRVNSI